MVPENLTPTGLLYTEEDRSLRRARPACWAPTKRRAPAHRAAAVPILETLFRSA